MADIFLFFCALFPSIILLVNIDIFLGIPEIFLQCHNPEYEIESEQDENVDDLAHVVDEHGVCEPAGAAASLLEERGNLLEPQCGGH